MKPKIQFNIKPIVLLCFTLFVAEFVSAQIQVLHSESGTIPAQAPDKPCVSPGYYAILDAEIAANVAQLAAAGKLIGPQGMLMPPPQKFDWPLTYETSFYGNDYFFIQNYVDHNNASGSISEYMCGTRSYDLPNGYDHQGTDICIGPYWWNMMDDMKVRVIAAAPGQIISRFDGNFDRNCGFGSDTANSVTIQHEDGTRALYLHMKTGSVTSKGVGDFVETGEFLGYVGSSGSSTNPHLHFEVRDSNNNFIDPWMGPCNPDIFQSLWNSQKPYPNSGIMSILTMTGVATTPPCPAAETVPISNHFDQGDLVRVEIHLRDLLPLSTSVTRIYNPFGVVVLTWNDTTANFFSAGNWFSFTYNLPNNTPLGTYRIEVNYQSRSAAHYFTVGCPPAYNLSGPRTGYKGYLTGDNITSTHTISGASANNIWYEAEDYIRLDVGFHASTGCRFRARIDNCAVNSSIVARIETGNSTTFSLQANPNVTTDLTRLRLDLVQDETISISVYDLTGRNVKTVIADQTIGKGTHEFELSTAEFTSGVYFCVATTTSSRSLCKLVVQK